MEKHKHRKTLPLIIVFTQTLIILISPSFSLHTGFQLSLPPPPLLLPALILSSCCSFPLQCGPPMCSEGVGASKRQWCASIQCHICAMVIKKHGIHSAWHDSTAAGLGGSPCPSEPLTQEGIPWQTRSFFPSGKRGLDSLCAHPARCF